MSKGIERVLIAGCGYVGSQVARLLSKRDIDVWCLNRNPKNLPQQFKQVCGDVTDLTNLPKLDGGFDALVYAVSPGNRTEENYRSVYYEGLGNVINRIGHSVRVILVSSTGVFSQNEGEWVTEDTNPNPVTGTAQQLLRAETLALELGDPGIIIRLAGIYGPGRTRMIKRILDKELDCPETNHFTNRIHRDDSARSICHLLELPSPRNLYLGVDSDPASLHSVYTWLASKVGSEDPCAHLEKSRLIERDRLRTNKRCSNERLLKSGYSFLYPTFREGYGPLIRPDPASSEHVS